MLDLMLKIIAPHHCYNCQIKGSGLCNNCKNYIISEPINMCLACGRASITKTGICTICKPPYKRAWCVGSYEDGLKDTIHGLKFERAKAVSKDLADLLEQTIPVLPKDIVVTYVTTLPSHRRLRGYDQARLIAKAFARKRGLKFEKTLDRVDKTHQRGASSKMRWAQAKNAYKVNRRLSGTYLIIDDVVTTGATLHYTSKALLDAGAGEVWVAAVARQTLD